MGITHATAATGTDSGDGKISKNAWNEDHTIDWAEAGDLSAIAPAAAAGSVAEVPYADHVHRDSAAGVIYAYMNFR